MIVFDLSCQCGCQFEGWFQDSADCRYQEKAGLLTCPSCDGTGVKKILSPVAGKTVVGQKNDRTSAEVTPGRMAVDLLKSLQDHVLNNYEDVGPRLLEESLKIHYGVEEPRNIRGVSSEEEEKVLEKEGIKLLKIPLPAKSDKN